jgi:hypothetical protein
MHCSPSEAKPFIVRSTFYSVSYVVCHDKAYMPKRAIQLVLSQYCILRISYDEPVSPDHHKIHNANYLVLVQRIVFVAIRLILDIRSYNNHVFVYALCQIANV